MDLIKKIEELLYFHECVTVPNFGSFLVSDTTAKVDSKIGKFISPKRKVSFNALIKQNDGILAKYISTLKIKFAFKLSIPKTFHMIFLG